MLRQLLRRLTAPTPRAAAAPPELPADVLPLVLAQLDGDVSALCACACVCRHWRDLVLSTSQPQARQLWRTLRVPRRVAARLTDERLRALVARARGALERLNISYAVQLTDAGVAAALKRQRSLAHLAAVGCVNLSADGLALALRGRKLATLRVRGISMDPNELPPAFGGLNFDEDGDGGGAHINPAALMAEPALARLRERLAEPAGDGLDAVAGCTFLMEAEHGYDDDLVCGCLCSEQDRMCDSCDAYHCVQHNAATSHDGSDSDSATLMPDEGAEEEDAPRCACCNARMCNNCQDNASLGDFGRRHLCDFCGACHCPRCITGNRAMPYAECDDCGKSACDACVRVRRIRLFPAADGGGGLRFLCGDGRCDGTP